MKNVTEFDHLLEKWEETYKKGLLTLWLLLQLRQRPSYAFEMNDLIHTISQGTISAEDNSIYRALNRFEDMGIVASRLQATGQGPDRRYYVLTDRGSALLRQFIQRNLLVFQSSETMQRFSLILSETEQENP